LFLLQCCSVMAPPEEFVERIQTRFGLTAYFDLTLSSPNEYEPILAEEFLALLIRLVSERGFCGLTTVEALRRELVQRLAVGDATHSSLLKALPPRLQDNKHVQECLDAVAAFRSPSGMQQVVLSHVFCSSHMMSLCGINVCWSEKNTSFLQKSIVYLLLRDGLLLF
jgi:hypothetical protein